MAAATALIAEDEPLLRADLRDLLGVAWPGLEIIHEAADGDEALEQVARRMPDVLFLDIHMPGTSGLAVAERVSGRAHVVFVTAYDQYAITAFEGGALDYVLKPPSLDRIRRTVARVQERLRSAPADLGEVLRALRQAAAPATQYLRWLTVPQGTERRVVATNEICFLRAEQKYTTLATRDGTFLLTSSLRELRERLDPEQFWQIHRGILVNVAAIETIYRTFRGGLELKVGGRSETLPVSAAHAHLFRQF